VKLFVPPGIESEQVMSSPQPIGSGPVVPRHGRATAAAGEEIAMTPATVTMIHRGHRSTVAAPTWSAGRAARQDSIDMPSPC
jgi:hypothetical protein